jgi:uncharacterized protein
MAPAGRTGTGTRLTEHAVETSRGTAEADLLTPRRPSALLVLGHGAGGGVTAPDLVAVRDAAVTAGLAVARVTQPYRVTGRRAPAPARHLDDAFGEVVAALRTGVRGRLPLIVGGRSSGARVACRTAAGLGAVAVLALAFPLHPPGRPEKSRAAELDTGLPTLVVNGDRDPFGVPPAGGEVTIQVVPGAGHDLRRDPGLVAELAVRWLRECGWAL